MSLLEGRDTQASSGGILAGGTRDRVGHRDAGRSRADTAWGYLIRPHGVGDAAVDRRPCLLPRGPLYRAA